jgi:hypothetical protein
MLLEGAAHAFLATKTDGFGDSLDRFMAGFQQSAGRLKTQLFDRLRRCLPGRGDIGAGEVPRTHAELLGQSFHA